MKRYILFLILFWAIHLLEGLPPIGGISIAQIWKIPLLGYLIIVTFQFYRQKYQKYSYYLAIESIVNNDVIINTISTIASAAKLLPLALFSSFFKNKVNPCNNEKYILWIAQYIAIVTIPYLTGLLQPIHSFDASFISVDFSYFSGCFGGAHVASSYFSIAILVILSYFFEGYFPSRKEKLFNGILLLVLFLSVYKSYVRTGWLMLFVGLVTLVISDSNRYTRFRNLILLSISFLFSVVFLYNSNETFRMRMSGSTRYTSSNESIDVKGSGRVMFWQNGYELWKDSETISEYMFGRGITEVKDNNYKKTGMHVFSHSQFVDALAQHGILGLLLLLLFYGSLYKHIRMYRESRFYRLNISIWTSAVVFSILQSEMYFVYALIFGISIAVLETDELQIQ